MSLASLRREIDAVDANLVVLLAKRVRLVREVAALKAKDGLPAYDGGREIAIAAAAEAQAARLSLSPDLGSAIVAEAIRLCRRAVRAGAESKQWETLRSATARR
jgi:chorismate mutase